MCAACGIATHVPLEELRSPGPARFAALKQRDCGVYLAGGMLSMMADNVEHVITYWVMWSKFHSPALAGFAVISHWLPFLFLSVHFGALADRYDCRRVIQAAQLLFMSVSIAWGVLFLTGALQIWQACVLLVLHGMAGSLWAPAEQLMLHDFVGPREVPSAVRLNATARSLGVLFGPVVGSALLLGLGPTAGIFCNVAIYLPLTVFLLLTKYTGHTREAAATKPRLGLRDAVHTIREVSGNQTIMSMIVLAGLASFFGGASLQSAMPIFAHDLGASAGTAYGVLLFANGIGGVAGGLLLEVFDRLKATVGTAVWTTFVMGLSLVVFAVTRVYAIAIVALVIGGVASLASMSIGQTIVQLLAPAAKRGRVVGVYSMSASGMRIGSGITVGVLGAAIGVHTSLAASSGILCVGALAVFVWLRRGGSGANPNGGFTAAAGTPATGTAAPETMAIPLAQPGGAAEAL
jgi:MFS family permease